MINIDLENNVIYIGFPDNDIIEPKDIYSINAINRIDIEHVNDDDIETDDIVFADITVCFADGKRVCLPSIFGSIESYKTHKCQFACFNSMKQKGVI